MNLKLGNIGRMLFLLASIWSVAVSAYILLTPLGVQGVTATVDGGSGVVESFTQQASWYQVQGLWGIAVLLIFAALYTSTAFFAWRRQFVPLGIVILAALTLTYLAGFSVGPYYLPAALAVLVGGIFTLVGGLYPAQGRAST